MSPNAKPTTKAQEAHINNNITKQPFKDQVLISRAQEAIANFVDSQEESGQPTGYTAFCQEHWLHTKNAVTVCPECHITLRYPDHIDLWTRTRVDIARGEAFKFPTGANCNTCGRRILEYTLEKLEEEPTNHDPFLICMLRAGNRVRKHPFGTIKRKKDTTDRVFVELGQNHLHNVKLGMNFLIMR